MFSCDNRFFPSRGHLLTHILNILWPFFSVIDFCLTKQLTCDQVTNYTSLKMAWASQASCKQRAGRAGRVSTGRVYRLVPAEYFSVSIYIFYYCYEWNSPWALLVIIYFQKFTAVSHWERYSNNGSHLKERKRRQSWYNLSLGLLIITVIFHCPQIFFLYVAFSAVHE